MDDIADKLAEKFISWPLPTSVCSDLIVTMPGEKHRIGTNLLTYFEARQMMQEVVLPTLREMGISITPKD